MQSSRKDHFDMLPMEEIQDNPFQLGYPPGESEVVRAAYQVRDQGMTFPLVVRPWGAGHQIASGQLWLAACRLLGVRKVPVLIRALSDEDMASLAFEEASLRGIITPGHGAVLLGTVGNAWISNLLDRLRSRADGYQVEVDPEAARNLPVPQPTFLQQAPAAAQSLSDEVLASLGPDPLLLVAPDRSATPMERGIYDTLMGFRCRHTPLSWFQTVMDVGKRWVLESASSGGQLEILSPLGRTGAAAEAVAAFRAFLLERHPSGRLEEAPPQERSGLHRFVFEMEEGDLRHQFILLWKAGRSVMLHLSNTPRFFLYDVKGMLEIVESAEIL